MKCRYFCRLPLDISPVYLTRGISKINSEVTALSIAGIRVPEMKKTPSIYTVCYIKFIFNYSN